MTSTRIEWSFNKIARLTDLSNLAEMLFPGNRNQQHAFMAICITIKWSDHRMVPNLAEVAAKHGISRRTLERVRAKMRRMGLIDHVSRFHAAHGGQEGWMFSTRFERSLRQLSEKIANLWNSSASSRDKDELLLQLAEARRSIASQHTAFPDHDSSIDEGGEIE